MFNAKFSPSKSNGFKPVSALDIECLSNISGEQANAIKTIFRTIGRLTDDAEIKGLCEHGSLQAEMLFGDLDVIREQAECAGLADVDAKTLSS